MKKRDTWSSSTLMEKRVQELSMAGTLKLAAS